VHEVIGRTPSPRINEIGTAGSNRGLPEVPCRLHVIAPQPVACMMCGYTVVLYGASAMALARGPSTV
jgi:hypothetical protein